MLRKPYAVMHAMLALEAPVGTTYVYCYHALTCVGSYFLLAYAATYVEMETSITLIATRFGYVILGHTHI